MVVEEFRISADHILRHYNSFRALFGPHRKLELGTRTNPILKKKTDHHT
jgi:hypothetical protein